MHKLISNLWYGSEESYFAFLDAQERLTALQAQGAEALKAAVISAGGGRGEDPFGLPPLWNLEGNTAVLNIEGSLIDGNAGFLRLFGAIGYGDIQQALYEIGMDKNAKTVLLNVNSGGGQVSGVEDTGEMIQALDKSKPVMAYTGGTMGSAAYWLGSSARTVAAAKTAQVGSVGTLIIHTERSKARAEAGITDTVVRYGKYKALGNPYEPLSDTAKEELQNLADESGKIFVAYVADRRGMTAEQFQKTAGEGRVFMGRQAKEAGLIDGVMNMASALSHAKSLDKGQAQQHTPRNSGKAVNMKLSKKTVLAIAAGTMLSQLGLAEPEANLEGVKLEGDALAAAETEAKEISAAVEQRVVAGVTEATAPLTAQVADLTAKLEAATVAVQAADGKVALAEAAANDFKAKLDTSASLAASQAEIVKASISVMSVALGGAADVAAALTGTELLAEHDRIKEQFAKKFPTGGVAAVVTPKQAPAKAPLHPLFASLVSKTAAK